MIWNILIVSLCLILLAFLLWKELKRVNKMALVARIVATLVAVVSLALIAIPVTVRRTTQSIGPSSAILLTNGYHKDSIQKFLKNNPGVASYTMEKNISSHNATYVADLGALSDEPLNISTVHVFGFGLYEHDWKQAPKLNVVFHPSAIENSITSVSWQQRITSGEPLTIQGKYHNSSREPVKIVLRSFDTNMDSTTVPPNQHSNFSLTTTPKHVDKAVYSLMVFSGGDTVETNPIPVEVEVSKMLNVLLLASSPDFDNKFLKNWLAENGYGVAVRTYISKNKYDKQFLNLSSLSLGSLNASLLKKFDVVIADLTELNMLPSSDLSNLRSFVENQGLGLIVKANAVPRTSAFYLSSFQLQASRDSVQHTVKLNGGSTSFAGSLKIQQPVYIISKPGTKALITDQHTRTLVSAKLLGLGKVIITTVPNSYAWWLAGNKEDYSSYWTLMLSKAAKKIVRDPVWEHTPALLKKGFPANIILKTAATDIPRLQVSSEIIYPRQNLFLPYEWSARYWPRKSGWLTMMNNTNQASWLYIFGESDWQGIAAGAKVLATKKYAGPAGYTTAEVGRQNVPVEIPKIYFFILFIISAAFLWFEKKYRNG